VSHQRGGLVLALAIAAVGAVAAVLLRPPIPVDETRYLSVAWEMWVHGDWLVPHLNGQPYSDKPPLLFWSMHAAWAIFGVSEIAARLVPPLYGLSSIALTFVLARRLWPDRPGVGDGAALIVAGTMLFALMSTTVMFDSSLTFAVLVGMLGLADQRQGRPLRGWGLFGVATGLGVLAKGPVVLVHLLPAAVLAPLWWREQPKPRWGHWYLGLAGALALGAAIGLAWTAPAAIAGGEAYRTAIFVGQSAGRIVGSFAHAEPFWFYLVLLPLAFFPWIWWPPAWRAARRLRAELDDPLRMLAVSVIGSFLLLSAISGKQGHYLLPIVPGFALILARALSPGHAEATGLAGKVPFLLPLALGIAQLGSAVWLASGHRLTPFLANLPWWFGPALIALAGLAAIASRRGAALLVLALFAPLMLLLIETAGQTAFRAYALSDLAGIARQHEAGGIAVVDQYLGEITFLGRLQRPVDVLPSPKDAAAWAAAHPLGVIVAPVSKRRDGPPWAPIYLQPYRSGEIGVWQAP
jgi:4-amino-4-deoxy-L-arabinose transferase-like glycosyltransferase